MSSPIITVVRFGVDAAVGVVKIGSGVGDTRPVVRVRRGNCLGAASAGFDPVEAHGFGVGVYGCLGVDSVVADLDVGYDFAVVFRVASPDIWVEHLHDPAEVVKIRGFVVVGVPVDYYYPGG